MNWLLFESVTALGALLGTILFVLLVYWRRGGSARPLLVGLGVTAILLIVQSVVNTPREQAKRVLGAIVDDLIKGQATALAAALAPDFVADDGSQRTLDRAKFLDYIGRRLERVDVTYAYQTQLDVTESDGERFTVNAGYLSDVVIDQFSGTFRSRWLITFRRGDSEPQIVNIRPDFVDGIPTPTWAEIARH